MAEATDRYVEGDIPAHAENVMEPGAPNPGWYCRDCGAVVVHRAHHDTLHERTTT